MRSSFWVSVFLIVIGIVMIILPDQNDRVVAFNRYHGPSWIDLTGIVFIVVTWMWMVAKTFVRRKMVVASIGKKGVILAILAVVSGGILIAGGLIQEFDKALYTGIGISIIGYAMLFIPVFRNDV